MTAQPAIHESSQNDDGIITASVPLRQWGDDLPALTRIHDAISGAQARGVQPVAIELGDAEWAQLQREAEVYITTRYPDYAEQVEEYHDVTRVYGLPVRRVESPSYLVVRAGDAAQTRTEAGT